MSKILIDEATVKLALEALEYIEHNYMSLPAPAEKAITALREALTSVPDWASEAKEQPAPRVVDCHATGVCVQSGLRAEQPAQQGVDEFDVGWNAARRFYTSPPAQRTWVNATTWRGLTDEQIIKCWGQVSGTRYGYVAFARAIEAKLRSKND